jgi:hypothetical protein
MSLLTICQDVADEIGLDKPTSIIGNSENTATRLYRQCVRTGTMLAIKNWHLLIKPYTFSTVADEPQYALPSDWRSFVNNTAWNQTKARIIYIISPQHWAYEKSYVVSTFNDQYRLMGDDAAPSVGRKFTIHPTPSSVQTIYYEYYSKNWVLNADGVTEQSTFVGDNDTVQFNQELFIMGVIWRMLKTMGQPYAEEKAEFDQYLEMLMAQDGVTENLYADGNPPPFSNIPETGFGP